MKVQSYGEKCQKVSFFRFHCPQRGVSSYYTRVAWLASGSRLSSGSVEMTFSDLLGLILPLLLFSQLHVHVVFDGNRVFQAQMKLWGVSEEKRAEAREVDSIKGGPD